MKRLAVVTGSRSEYGQLRPFLRLAFASSRFETALVVAGEHLLPKFGKTVAEVRQEFPIAAHVPMYQRGETDQAKALGRGVCNFAGVFGQLQPDLVLVEGDRLEALAAALAASYAGIPVAHGGGGDITRTIDNAARHAISQFASLHFVSTEEARERLLRMGCDPTAIHVTGALGIDAILAAPVWSREATLADLRLPPGSRYLLVAFHPESDAVEQAGERMDALLDACYSTGLLVVVIYPNSDPGSGAIIASIKRHASNAFPSLSSERFLNALRHADALVGNSSSGLYEAPTLRVPVVNVGRRQDGRLKAANILDCDYGYERIRAALAAALRGHLLLGPVKNPYGDGKAADRMLAVIERRLGE